MTTFETGAEIDVSVSSASLRDARQTIERELGDVSVSISETGAAGGGGSRIAGRERAMARQLQTRANNHLSSIDSAWDENLALNEERNDLLRELIDTTEMAAQSSSGGGRLPIPGLGLVAGAIGMGAGGAAIGARLLQEIDFSKVGEAVADAVPEIDPSEFVDGTVDIAEHVAGQVSVEEAVTGERNVADVIVGTITAPAIVTGTVAATALIEGEVSLSERLTGEVSIADRVTGAVDAETIVAGAVAASTIISGVISPTEILSTVSLAALVDVVSAADLITPVPLSALIEEAAEPTGDGGGADPWPIIGGAGAGAGAAAIANRLAQSGGGRAVGGRAAGGATPVFTRDMFTRSEEDWRSGGNERLSIALHERTPEFMDPVFPDPDEWEPPAALVDGRSDTSGPTYDEAVSDVYGEGFSGQRGGSAGGPAQRRAMALEEQFAGEAEAWANLPNASEGGGNVEVNVDNSTEYNLTAAIDDLLREIRREQERDRRDLESELEELRRQFTRGR